MKEVMNHSCITIGPDLWAALFPDTCGPTKTRQSPIDIQKSSTKFDDRLADVDLLDQQQQPAVNYTLVNNGHSGKYHTIHLKITMYCQ